MNPTNHFFVKKLTQLDALGDTVLTWFTYIVDNVDNTDNVDNIANVDKKVTTFDRSCHILTELDGT